ncbi:integrase domain-containing protein [Vibrio superstes]|uniref:integrase domain-containing protein n=1 Tax=Vibrio superstes TaxID=198815 RepID=UPI000E5AC96D|nr:integrase domain-containing protein [Vibrio superstes]
MPRPATRLSHTKILALSCKNKEQLLTDGNGLTLRVRPNGSKVFYFQYSHPLTKKRTKLQIGKFPHCSLKQARKTVLEYRDLLDRKIDPKSHLAQQQEEELNKEKNLLANVAEEWLEVKKHSVTKDYAHDILRSLELHVFPSLGTVPISKITAPEVIKVLKVVESKGNLETVKRLCQRLNEVIDFAVNTGKVFSNPISKVHVAFKKPKAQNMKSIPPSELPELLQTISRASLNRVTRCLIEFQLHTMTRPSEASNTLWEEIDLEQKIWTIPASKMKRRREHVVPLSEYCIELLCYTKSIRRGSPYVFPSPTDNFKPLNSQTVNAALKRMGYQGKLVSHGFRSIASTALNEEGFDFNLIESALAHVDPNQTRAAYNRATYIERRRKMMNWWSQRILGAKSTHL